jgi:pimeloyl-ACP methyl ester carboxylesterase
MEDGAVPDELAVKRRRPERLLTLAGASLAAAHVVDAAFVDTEPGASIASHVPWAAAALVLLTFLALGSHRLPRLARGFLLGALGAASLADGAQHLKFAGDDLSVTGLLLLPAGLALVVAAGLAIWGVNAGRSRGRAWARRAAILLGGVALAFFVVFPGTLAVYLAHKPRPALGHPALGAPYRDVGFRTSDGLTIRGWYVAPRNGAAIVLVHGSGGDRRGPVPHARVLVRHGYGVLLIDARGRGESDGDNENYGWHWDRDVRAAVTFLRAQPGVRHVGAFGLSTGAEVVVQTAAEDRRIEAVAGDGVEERTTTDARSIPWPEKLIGLPLIATSTAAYQALTLERTPPPLKRLLPEISPRPLLLIASKDELPIDRVWIRDAREPKRLLAFPDAAHTKGLATHPRAYEEALVGFFDRALLAR